MNKIRLIAIAIIALAVIGGIVGSMNTLMAGHSPNSNGVSRTISPGGITIGGNGGRSVDGADGASGGIITGGHSIG
jgi:hypothetical protein